MNNYLSRLYYAKFRYLEFPGSSVIQGFIPGTKICFSEILFHSNSILIKTCKRLIPIIENTFVYLLIHAILTLYIIKNCIHLLFISPILFYFSTWNSVCKLKMIHIIILPKDKFTRLTKPEISGGAKKPPPLLPMIHVKIVLPTRR